MKKRGLTSGHLGVKKKQTDVLGNFYFFIYLLSTITVLAGNVEVSARK